MQEPDYLQFEAYISGQMNADDIRAFEKQLSSDADFERAFNDYKQTEAFLKHKFQNEALTQGFKENLEAVSSRYFDNNPVPKTRIKRFKPWYYVVAAAVVILLGILITQPFSRPVYDDFANYGHLSFAIRNGEVSLETKAEVAFNQKNYKDAEYYLSQLLQTDENNIEFKLYKAVCLVELNNFEEADALYQDIIQSPSVYVNTALWYLALSKLKQEKHAETIKVLQSIPEDADDFKQAQKLLRQLK